MEEEALDFFLPSSTPPKLTLSSFTSFPSRAECPGMATPPIRLAGAIPFKWEVAPGRPMQKPNQLQTCAGSASATADADRQLGLPPRLSASAAIREERVGGAKTLSPATVIDGPCFLIRRPLSFTFGGKKHLSFGKKRRGKWDVSSEKSSTEDTLNSSVSSSSSSSSSFNSSSIASVSSCSNGEGRSEGGEEESKEEVVGEEVKEEERMVKILRYKRKMTLTCVTSHTASQLWASIIGRLKQAVVQCKRDPKV